MYPIWIWNSISAPKESHFCNQYYIDTDTAQIWPRHQGKQIWKSSNNYFCCIFIERGWKNYLWDFLPTSISLSLLAKYPSKQLPLKLEAQIRFSLAKLVSKWYTGRVEHFCEYSWKDIPIFKVAITMISYPINVSFMDMRVHFQRKYCTASILPSLLSKNAHGTYDKAALQSARKRDAVEKWLGFEKNSWTLLWVTDVPMLQAISSCEKIPFLLLSAGHCNLFLFIKHHCLQVNNLST